MQSTAPTHTGLSLDIVALDSRCSSYEKRDPAVWISRFDCAELARRATALPKDGPLCGLTFAIKDNIDLAGLPTTAACPGYAYMPEASAPVVARLQAAGALPVGKTNLDQFATGLVGVRSPHGAPRNVFNSEYISGGSSSGSAVAVAAGLVDFALGTDTAGSGRVPAAFNGIVGLKPTRGRLSTGGVVPACRSLDCVSIFTRDIALAARVLAAAEGFDECDAFSRQPRLPTPAPLPAAPRVGVPRSDQHEWFGDAESPALFAAAVARLREIGATVVEVDFSPFFAAARLLYEGPWTAERYAAVGEFIERHSATPESVRAAGLDPTVAGIILGGKAPSAADAFRATYRLAELRRAADSILADVDALVAPTAGTVYTVAQVEADPVHLNSNLGRTNNFLNLLDLCGLTLPTGRYASGPGFGVTLIAPAWHDERLLEIGARFLGEPSPPLERVPAPAHSIQLAVVGAHLMGQPLNSQLTSRGARLLRTTRTAAEYRLHALANTSPPKPGLVRDPGFSGPGIEVEVWSLTPTAFGEFTVLVPAPLAIGNLALADGSMVKGFVCEPAGLIGATEITSHGGWRVYLAARSANA